MVHVINEMGERKELRNFADLKQGDQLIISGLDINRVQFVKQWEIEQMQAPKGDPRGAKVLTPVPQFHFSFGQRSFTVTGEGLQSDAEALLNTIKKTAKGGARVKECYLIANQFHPQLTDAEGNLVFSDENRTMPAFNEEVTNYSFLFSGVSTAEQVAAEQDDNLTYEAKRNKLNLGNKEAIKAAIADMETA